MSCNFLAAALPKNNAYNRAMTIVITGFDPLHISPSGAGAVHDRAAKAAVSNILKSYTGHYDPISEAVQNALDALELRVRDQPGFKPHIWINLCLDDSSQMIRVVDNGIGMAIDEFVRCFTPNLSFKNGKNLRGNKGVGATYLAYGFNHVRIFSKHGSKAVAAEFSGGRNWVHDPQDGFARPKLREISFDVPELTNEPSGTCIEIRLTGAHGERPKVLGWQGARTAKAWFDVLRIVSPLGTVHIVGDKPILSLPTATVSVTFQGKIDSIKQENVQYYFPHEVDNTKSASIADVENAFNRIKGDTSTKVNRLPESMRNLDCLFEMWSWKDLAEEKPGRIKVSSEHRALLEKHDVSVYAAFFGSLKKIKSINSAMGLRENAFVLKGGLQIASDGMPQGELLVIPLKRYTGYQNTTHIVVHFRDGNPDMGRKTFQPELKELAEAVATEVTKLFVGYRDLLRPDTGSNQPLGPDKEKHEWIRDQEAARKERPFPQIANETTISYLSMPREEQDVIALFHQLIGAGVIRGIKFFGSHSNLRYDGLVELDYRSDDVVFDARSCILGIPDEHAGYVSEPKIVEYKFALSSLFEDFEKEIKFSKHISLAICWEIDEIEHSNLTVTSLLTSPTAPERTVFGATHVVYDTPQSRAFEVICLKDLISMLKDPDATIALQKKKYES